MTYLVRSQLTSGWQDIDAENDDGIDGIILLQRAEQFAGRVVFVQVKSGPSFRKDYKGPAYEKVVAVDLGAEYLAKHRPRWHLMPGPVLLAYVADPEKRTTKVYWQDLRADSSYSTTNRGVVLIPEGQTLGSHMKGRLQALCGSVSDDAGLPTIDMRGVQSRLANPSFNRKKARAFYREWALSSERSHPDLGLVIVSNLGWRHITRKSRRLENVYNSLALLEVAKQMIIAGVSWRQLGSATTTTRLKTIDVIDHISLRAKIKFKHRAAGPVQVILQRTRSISHATGAVVAKLAFLSVHELTRGSSQNYRVR